MNRQPLFPYIAIGQEGKGEKHMADTFDRITISHDEIDCYFHLLGDTQKYFDLEALEEAHPEYKAYIEDHRYELQRGLFELREMIETHEHERTGAAH